MPVRGSHVDYKADVHRKRISKPSAAIGQLASPSALLPVLDEIYWVNDVSLIIFRSEETIRRRSWLVRGEDPFSLLHRRKICVLFVLSTLSRSRAAQLIEP